MRDQVPIESGLRREKKRLPPMRARSPNRMETRQELAAINPPSPSPSPSGPCEEEQEGKRARKEKEQEEKIEKRRTREETKKIRGGAGARKKGTGN